jgi:hypothetical protein
MTNKNKRDAMAETMRLTHEERQERYQARTDEFKSGVISEDVYRASLFVLDYRGEDISMAVRENWVEKKCAR